MDFNRVAITSVSHAAYPAAPFHPPEAYPELRRQWPTLPIDPNNTVYPVVRQALRDLDFDRVHYDTADWNPLGELIQPGQRVVIKPNLVFHKHPLGDEGVAGMLTNGSVIRPLVDYAWLALQGQGQIIIADVPLQTADWGVLMKKTGLGELERYAQSVGINVAVVDLRLEHAFVNRYGVITQRKSHNGDPAGYVAVDLGASSLLMPIIDRYRQLTITDYPQQAVSQHHNPKRNEYLVAKTILSANVFINVPKMKTHKKSGVTLSMKNLIGINGDKSWIAHHREGTPDRGGDETPHQDWWDSFRYRLFVTLKYNAFGIRVLSVLQWLLDRSVRLAGRLTGRQQALAGLRQFRGITEGSWFGNDTLWRVILDLNRILLYSTVDGVMKSAPQRRLLQVVDGIIGGERNGPMHHVPKPAGTIVAGTNPLLTDIVTAEFMGFDYQKILQLAEGLKLTRYPVAPDQLSNLEIVRQQQTFSFDDWRRQPTKAFWAPSTWEGHIEHQRRDAADESRIEQQFEEEGGE